MSFFNWLFNKRTLDRVENFDDRSRDYPIITDPTGMEPVTRKWECDATLDQGREGACVGFGIAHKLIAEPLNAQDITATYAKVIYHKAQMMDRWPGEDYEGTSVLAGIKATQSLGWFDEYRWSFSFDELVLGLSHCGPAVIGMNWYEGMRRPDKDGYIYMTGQKTGGHCLLINGVDIEGQRFTLHNSWGWRWGTEGECFISFSTMRKVLKDRCEVVFFQGRREDD